MSSSESSKTYGMADLLMVMSRLRDPDTGCDWDLQQSYESIAPSTLEEAYEVVDAIERRDYQHLREELGDLLFQVVFHSQLATEEQRFTFADVVADLAGKLIRRHPHVFPEGTLMSRRDPNTKLDQRALAQAWENIKEDERAAKGSAGVLDDVPVALPALVRAAKLQKRASRCGFDWSDIAPVFDQVDEEVRELREAIIGQSAEEIAEEAGDVLFSMVNLTRHLGLDGEAVLRQANQKFERRFRYIEEQLAKSGKTPEQVPTDQLEDLWQRAKGVGL